MAYRIDLKDFIGTVQVPINVKLRGGYRPDGSDATELEMDDPDALDTASAPRYLFADEFFSVKGRKSPVEWYSAEQI